MSTGNLVEEVFGDILHLFTNLNNALDESERICCCAILAPRNRDVDQINEEILHKLPGRFTEYLAMDSVAEEASDDKMNFPPGRDGHRPAGVAPPATIPIMLIPISTPEYLNSRTPSGMPPFRLQLKPGKLNHHIYPIFVAFCPKKRPFFSIYNNMQIRHNNTE